MAAITHARLAPRRGGVASTWWSKAWLRAVEEASFAAAELKAGRSLARSGAVGAITVSDGAFVAAVVEGHDAYTVTGTLPVLASGDQQVLVEIVAAETGRIAALMSGDLPLPMVEAVEEAGVELLPFGGELGSACSCDYWLDPCPHALAVLTQLAWLIQRDPFVLIQLRGLARDDVLARLHALSQARERSGSEVDQSGQGDDSVIDNLAIGEEAALRAARELTLLLGEDAPPG